MTQNCCEPPRLHDAKESPQGAGQSNVVAMRSGDALIAGAAVIPRPIHSELVVEVLP